MSACFYHIVILFNFSFPEDVSNVCDDLVRYDCFSSSTDCKQRQSSYVQFITMSVVVSLGPGDFLLLQISQACMFLLPSAGQMISGSLQLFRITRDMRCQNVSGFGVFLRCQFIPQKATVFLSNKGGNNEKKLQK